MNDTLPESTGNRKLTPRQASRLLDEFYAKFGRAVFLVLDYGEKKFRNRDWEKITFEETQRAPYRSCLVFSLVRGGNVAVRLGPLSDGLRAIDIDIKTRIAEFKALNPALDSTIAVYGLKGAQFFFRNDGQLLHKNNAVDPLKTKEGTDYGELRHGENGGAYSMIYGQHPDDPNVVFRLEGETVVSVKFYQQHWPEDIVLPWFEVDQGKVEQRKRREGQPKKEVAIDAQLDRRIKAYLEACQPSIAGEHGDDRLFEVACKIHNGFALTIEQTAEMLSRYFNPRCQPPWDEERVRYKAEQAEGADHQEPRGHLLSEPEKLEAEALSIAKSLEAFYDQDRKEYLIKIEGGRAYQAHTETQFVRDLRFSGLTRTVISGRSYSQIDIVLRELQQKHFVTYAGPLAGKGCGFYSENGERILVTSEPRVITPSRGDWSTLNRLFTNLFCGKDEPHGEDQLTCFYSWIRTGYLSLRDRHFQPGQALAIAGVVECGKSLVQDLLTVIFGGRAAKAAMFLQGRTDFNSDLFGAEHLVLEDELASTTHPARTALGANIKAITANRIHACHAKYRQIVNLAPWWRLTISLNSRPERLLILPPLTDDNRDKIILLRATKHNMPMPTESHEDKERFWNALVGELPAFLAFLVEEFRISKDWQNSRFGVRAFHHPGLLVELEALSPAIQLLELIDLAQIWEVQSDVWEGPALQLRSALLCHHKTSRDAGNLLNWVNACGQYLNDLCEIRPERVKFFRNQDLRWYKIYRQILQTSFPKDESCVIESANHDS